MENLIYAKLLLAIKAEIAQATEIIIASLKQNSEQTSSPVPVQPSIDRFLRPKEAKAMLNICDNKLTAMRLKGKIDYIDLGSSFRYSENSIIKMMNSNSHRPNTEV